MSDISAAFLWAQLEQRPRSLRARLAIWETYHAALEDLETAGRIRRPVVPAHCTHNAHMYYVLLAEDDDRDLFLRRLAEDRVNAVFHYVPLHSSPAGLRFGRVHGSLGVTESAAERLVRLPLWIGMSENDVGRVVECVREALESG